MISRQKFPYKLKSINETVSCLFIHPSNCARMLTFIDVYGKVKMLFQNICLKNCTVLCTSVAVFLLVMCMICAIMFNCYIYTCI